MSTQTHHLPQRARGWHMHNPDLSASKNNFQDVLTLETHSIPKLDQHDILVAVHAVSLNWRDIAIITDTYPRPYHPTKHDGKVLCSDGAGIVLAAGDQVTRFKPGDHVAATFFPKWIKGLLQPEMVGVARGAESDGMLREFAVLGEEEAVKVPSHLSLEEASTLPCAGLTAWNSLFGHGGEIGIGRRATSQDTVLVQGTGGVSLFAAQFALAQGADVVATTSSEEKMDKMQGLVGVPKGKITNYRTHADWGTEVKRLTKDGKGVDIVVEVAGSDISIRQSYAALKMEGQVAIVGTSSATKARGEQDNLPSRVQRLRQTYRIDSSYDGRKPGNVRGDEHVYRAA